VSTKDQNLTSQIDLLEKAGCNLTFEEKVSSRKDKPEFDRDMISERTKEGLKAARARGRVGGRKKGLSEAAQSKAYFCRKLYEVDQVSISEIRKMTGISSSATVYKYLRFAGIKIGAI